MKSSHSSLAGAERMIVLNELRVDTAFGKGPHVPAFSKKTSLISKPLGRNQKYARQIHFFDNHLNSKTQTAIDQTHQPITSSTRGIPVGAHADWPCFPTAGELLKL